MVESLKELNKICQKPEYKKIGNWMVRHFLRDAALPCTWLLLHTPVTANQVTGIALGIGLMGVWLFAGTGSFFFLASVVILQIWYYLDHVDGQIARYRKTDSLTGRFLDFLMHHVIHGSLFFAWGWYLWEKTHHNFFILLGFILAGGMTLFNMIPDITYKAFFEKISKDRGIKLKQNEPLMCGPKHADTRMLKTVFSLIHKSCEMHVLMNCLTVAALIQKFIWPRADLRSILFVYFAPAVLVLLFAKLMFIVRSKKIDAEFQDYFESSHE